VYSVLDADLEYRISFYPNPSFSSEKLSNTCQKGPKLRPDTSICWTFLTDQYFFTDVFIAFCSA
jgi:hypothetical protein